MTPAGQAPVLLASRSPRRAALLAAAGIPFEAGPAPDVDETPPAGLAPRAVVLHLAEAKVRAVLARVPPGRTVLCADTLVALDSELLGKPADAAGALAMLGRLQGREHDVLTGVAVGRDASVWCGAARARVRLDALSESERAAYVATGEPLDKAGAYAIQGQGSAFVHLVAGGLDTVIGLPVELVRLLLAQARA